MDTDFWRKCSSCKSPLAFAQKYWVCSVSTCNRARTGLAFCSVSCFDAHVPMLNHRDAGAIEKRAPSRGDWEREQQSQAASAEPAPRSAPGDAGTPASGGEAKRDVLIIASRAKDYVRAKSGLNTSDSVMDALSEKVRALLDDAIRRALQDERKTVLDRDVR